MKKQSKGITLVALIVTIIILLILAGISIASLTGNGLFEKAKLAKERQENAEKLEDETLEDYENKIGEYIDNSRDTITLTKQQYDNILKRLDDLENQKTVIGTYTGTGTLGSASPNSLTFDRAPELVIIYGTDYANRHIPGAIFMQGCKYSTIGTYNYNSSEYRHFKSK